MSGFLVINGPFPGRRGFILRRREASFLLREPLLFNLVTKSVTSGVTMRCSTGVHTGWYTQGGWEAPYLRVYGGIYTMVYTHQDTQGGIYTLVYTTVGHLSHPGIYHCWCRVCTRRCIPGGVYQTVYNGVYQECVPGVCTRGVPWWVYQVCTVVGIPGVYHGGYIPGEEHLQRGLSASLKRERTLP